MSSSPASSSTPMRRSGDVGTARAERFLSDHPALIVLGRFGWVAKGVVYGLVGVLALSIAIGSDGSDSSTPAGTTPAGTTSTGGAGAEASQSGAIATIADASYGAVTLVAVGVGLLIYACWRIVTAVLPADTTAKAWFTRFGYVVSAVLYALLAWSAFSFVSNRGASGSAAAGGDSEDAKVERFTREVMSHSGGRWLVALAGGVLIALGIYFLRKGTKERFEDQLTGRGVGPVSYRHLVVLGRIGWVGRGLMVALIGTFLVRAAMNFDPAEAQGLDGSLRQTVDSTVGAVFVVVVAVGLIAYGVYCVVSAPQRRLASADE